MYKKHARRFVSVLCGAAILEGAVLSAPAAALAAEETASQPEGTVLQEPIEEPQTEPVPVLPQLVEEDRVQPEEADTQKTVQGGDTEAAWNGENDPAAVQENESTAGPGQKEELKPAWRVWAAGGWRTDTTGRSMPVTAVEIWLKDGNQRRTAGIEYRVRTNGSWSAWKADGATAGSKDMKKPLDGIQIRLTGEAAKIYDISYAAADAAGLSKGGPQLFEPARNGATAGTRGYGSYLTCLSLALQPKGQGTDTGAYAERHKMLDIRTHVQKKGWTASVRESAVAGAPGKGLRLEALQISLGEAADRKLGNIRYRAHVQNIGWQGWKTGGQTAGTTGQSKRIEAMQIQLTGALASHYDIYYRAYVQGRGWMGWTKNGASAGTTGKGLRLEGLEIRILSKREGELKDASDKNPPYEEPYVSFQTHTQSVGWQGWQKEGSTGGQPGKGRRVEALRIQLSSAAAGSSIQYRTHVQNIGWQGWKTGGQIAGTTGQRKRVEAVQIRLSGPLAQHYDILYRSYVQGFGWLGWAANGNVSGTTGRSARIEGLQIKLVPKYSTGLSAAASLVKSVPYDGAGRNIGPKRTFYLGGSILCVTDSQGRLCTTSTPLDRKNGGNDSRYFWNNGQPVVIDNYTRVAQFGRKIGGKGNARTVYNRLNAWCMKHTRYDYSRCLADAADLIDKRKGICNAYSEFILATMDSYGFGVHKIIGNRMNHAWNQIKIGSKWYYVDVTWNTTTRTNKYAPSIKLWKDHRLD